MTSPDFLLPSQEIIIPSEFKPLLNTVEDIGLDLDDTLVQDHPQDLALKIALFMYSLQNPSVNKEGFTVLKSGSKQDRTSYRDSLRAYAVSTFGSSHDFYKKVSTFVTTLHQNSARDTIIREEFGMSKEEFWDKFTTFDKSTPGIIRPVHGAVDMLNTLYNSHKRLHIVSNSNQQRIAERIAILEDNGFIGSFSSAISARDIGHEKPDPAGLIEVLRSKNLLKAESSTLVPLLYVGNALEDIQMAANANCIPVYYSPKGRIVDSAPKNIMIHSLKDVLKLVSVTS